MKRTGVDAKYPDEKRYRSFEKGAPTWARTLLKIRCTSCGKESEVSTQSNLGRPYENVCECGNHLYTDADPPILGWSASVDT